MHKVLIVLTLLVAYCYSADYVSVSFCGVSEDGIQRNYKASTCIDNTFQVVCNADDTITLKNCNGNNIASFETGNCVDGSPVWPGKQVFATCDNFHPAAPNGWTADIAYPASVTDCDPNAEPISSFFYPPNCRNVNNPSNYTMAPCTAEGINWFNCATGCKCFIVNRSAHNTCYDNNGYRRAIRCGGEPVSTPTQPTGVPTIQSSGNNLSVYLLFVCVHLLVVINM